MDTQLTRRQMFGLLAAAAGGALAAELERALWRPGVKCISIPGTMVLTPKEPGDILKISYDYRLSVPVRDGEVLTPVQITHEIISIVVAEVNPGFNARYIPHMNRVDLMLPLRPYEKKLPAPVRGDSRACPPNMLRKPFRIPRL